MAVSCDRPRRATNTRPGSEQKTSSTVGASTYGHPAIGVCLRYHAWPLCNLYLLLRQTCPPGLQVILAPSSVVLADDTEVQPDLLVAPRSQFTERDLPGPPLLAVEVLSPSTRRFDLLLKRDRFQEAGAASYWLVDPDVPSVTVLELHDGVFVEAATGSGDDVLRVTAPWPMTLVPARLLD